MRKLLLAAAVSTAFISTMAPAYADEFDKKTTITVNDTILIPGRSLPPGKYVMKLLNATANRHVVQIYNEDQTQLQATILAFNNYRLQPTSSTVLTYWETPAGTPPALRAWFWPGDNYGQEFAYPKATADVISKANNNATVASYSSDAALDADKAAKLEVQNSPAGSPTPYDSTVTAANSGAATPAAVPDSQPAAAPQVIAQATPQPQVQTATADQTTVAQPAANDNTLVAQNTTPQTTPQTTTTEPTELPRTASLLPAALAIGFASLLLAASLRLLLKA